MNFFFRQFRFCVASPRNAWATRKAMNAFRKANPTCAFTGRAPIDVHHVEPISVAPDKAADPANMISLTRDAHFIVGHAGDWKQSVPNVRALCDAVRIVKKGGGNVEE